MRRNPHTPHIALIASLVVVLALGSISCAKPKETQPAATLDDFDSLPPAELTERGARDSARVAQLVVAYLERVTAKQRDKALELFFPESLRVATAAGGIDVLGRSVETAARIAAEETTAARVRRIVLLRRGAKDLLENNYREIWGLRYVPERADSTPVERRVHVLQQLGSDTRWLGKLEAGR